MSGRILIAAFASEEDIVGATRAARSAGLRIVDTYTPYAVHGLAEAMGLPRSRLPILCFALAIVGAALKLWFEYWTATVDWPVNVGGKPWNSLPAFIPVTFEVMVLTAGVGTVLAFLFVGRLRPAKTAVLAAPGVTDDRFVLAIEESDATFDLERVKALLRPHNATSVEERLEEDSR